MMKINHKKCIRCGACVLMFKDDFIINDQGDIEVISDNINNTAIEKCPVGAIKK